MNQRAAARLGLTTITILLLGSASLYATEAQPVATGSGTITGTLTPNETVGEVASFLGIPYAAPPVGNLRWRAPTQPAKWSGTRAMSSFGKACPQSNPGAAPGGMGEDCLTLNVWTPAKKIGASGSDRLPVMVWIHGGGFRGGTGASPAADGTHFVEDGVVMVSINYRLGALGFFAHDGLSEATQFDSNQPGVRGNYGVMDMISALAWVRSNIGAFGGDPDRVTIFGMSAGGMAVQLLMVAPNAHGLFQGAIAMSGYGTWPLPRLGRPAYGHARAEDIGAEIAGFAKGTTAAAAAQMTAEELRALTPEQLVRGVKSLHLPLVDGVVIPDEPASIFAAGKQHDVPFVTGGASYDGAIMPMARIPHEPFLESLGDDLASFKRLYAGDFAVSDKQGASRLFGDARYLIASRFLGKNMAKVSSPAFLYFYHHVPLDKRFEWIGSPHGAEVLPMFGNFLSPSGPKDDETRAVGAMFRAAFVQFAKTGVPGANGMPEWPEYTEANDTWMVFGSSPVARRGVIRGRLNLLEERYLDRVSQ